jgi:hypothetical protein
MPALLDEKILALHGAFEADGLPHAFGGALALAYWATPRATLDIDVNLFVPSERAEPVLATLARLGVAEPTPAERTRLVESGQLRVRWEHVPIDLFFAHDPLHESCRARALRVPFGAGASIPILSAEDLAIFKVLFDRAKDRRDLRELLFAMGPDFDAAYALDWLQRIVASEDVRLARFDGMLRSEDGDGTE